MKAKEKKLEYDQYVAKKKQIKKYTGHPIKENSHEETDALKKRREKKGTGQ